MCNLLGMSEKTIEKKTQSNCLSLLVKFFVVLRSRVGFLILIIINPSKTLLSFVPENAKLMHKLY